VILTPQKGLRPWFLECHGPAHIIAMRFDRSDYSVAVKLGKPQNSWKWEINCAGKSLPVERSPVHFPTMSAANRAGKEALQQFFYKFYGG
jgi:hypothetical protein